MAHPLAVPENTNPVEEVLQETYLHAFSSLPAYRGEGSFRSWIARIAVVRAYQYWRREVRREKELTLSQLSLDQEHLIDRLHREAATERFTRDQRRSSASQTLRHALNTLSPDDQMVVRLARIEDRPVKEVADRLGWSVSKVKVRLHRVPGKLKKALNGSY